jgi:hypothetical protein
MALCWACKLGLHGKCLAGACGCDGKCKERLVAKYAPKAEK